MDEVKCEGGTLTLFYFGVKYKVLLIMTKIYMIIHKIPINYKHNVTFVLQTRNIDKNNTKLWYKF